MHVRPYAILLIAIVAGGGCWISPDKSAGTADTRKITLTKGDTISVRVDTEGKSRITVEIQEGKADAGTYTSTSEALLDDAREAVKSIHEPGAEVWIRVDEQDGIATIGNSQRIQ